MSTVSASAATLTSSVDSAATAADGEKPTHRRTSSHPAESPGGPSHKPAKHKVRHRKVKQGETIFKRHPSWNLMLNIKLGISYTVGKVTPERDRELTSRDFSTEYKQTFPPEGTAITPGHSADVFTFKDHAPFAFRHIRERFGVDAPEYMVSICGDSSLRELGTPGKSGAVFYLTEDNKFLIKTVSKKESKFLRHVLPNYYHYVMRSRDTLIPRVLGLIRIKTAAGRNIRMVVMNNLMPDDVPIHEKYDLKGSTLGRWATAAERRDVNVTLKDLDFKHTLGLPQKTHDALIAQFESDCAWLRLLGIMDYSLLALLHFPGRAATDPAYEFGSDEEGGGYPSGGGGGGMSGAEGGMSGGEGDSRDDTMASKSAPSAMRALQLGDRDSGSGGVARAAGTSPAGTLVSGGGATTYFSPRTPRAGETSAEESQADGGDSDDEKGEKRPPQLPKLSDGDLAAAYQRKLAAAANDATTAPGFSQHRGGLRAHLPHSGEEVIFYGGIIDILQQYVT